MFRDLERRIYVERIKCVTKNDGGAAAVGESTLLFFIIRRRIRIVSGESARARVRPICKTTSKSAVNNNRGGLNSRPSKNDRPVGYGSRLERAPVWSSALTRRNNRFSSCPSCFSRH